MRARFPSGFPAGELDYHDCSMPAVYVEDESTFEAKCYDLEVVIQEYRMLSVVAV